MSRCAKARRSNVESGGLLKLALRACGLRCIGVTMDERAVGDDGKSGAPATANNSEEQP
ncbi:MAG: hypothetical protein ABIP55_02775 [Tepidisphaeraceae bacterium]